MAADDEGGLGPAQDGSFGMSGSALIKGALREDLTANATQSSSTLTGATSYVIDLLERYGYNPDNDQAAAAAESETGEVDVTKDPESLIDPSLFPEEALRQSPKS